VNDVRVKRQKAIAEIIRSCPVTSQEDVTRELAQLGYAVTQATVSRDLDHLGAIKVKRDGLVRYALPDQASPSDWTAGRLQQIFGEWVLGVEAAGNLIVLRTPPGSAHLVALALDHAQLAEVAGTIAGDDTLFVAVRDGVTVARVTSQFQSMSGK
jgi:transcriptional regulator of arginine metabolism